MTMRPSSSRNAKLARKSSWLGSPDIPPISIVGEAPSRQASASLHLGLLLTTILIPALSRIVGAEPAARSQPQPTNGTTAKTSGRTPKRYGGDPRIGPAFKRLLSFLMMPVVPQRLRAARLSPRG